MLLFSFQTSNKVERLGKDPEIDYRGLFQVFSRYSPGKTKSTKNLSQDRWRSEPGYCYH
jgi:hypothetical protein